MHFSSWERESSAVVWPLVPGLPARVWWRLSDGIGIAFGVPQPQLKRHLITLHQCYVIIWNLCALQAFLGNNLVILSDYLFSGVYLNRTISYYSRFCLNVFPAGCFAAVSSFKTLECCSSFPQKITINYLEMDSHLGTIKEAQFRFSYWIFKAFLLKKSQGLLCYDWSLKKVGIRKKVHGFMCSPDISRSQN